MGEPRYLSGDEYAHTGGYEEVVNCKECKAEYDRAEYQSDTCSECEDKQVKRERERAIVTECITCKQKKDKFSQEWEYQQCEACSMIEKERQRV